MKDHDDWDDDTVIAESCVIDVLRCRGVCKAGGQLLALEELLCKGFDTTIDGIPVRLELLRAKNKFNPTAVDPTHFRNILNNVLFVYGERSTFAELQMHHQAILKYNDESHAHDHYNHFRSSLKDKYEEQLDPMLERQIIFFEEVSGVPVLLSLELLASHGRGCAEALLWKGSFGVAF